MNAQILNHFVDSRIQVQDCSIFYQQSVRHSSTPILFLHGWGISSEPYQEVLELIAEQHAVIAPDLPSFARSSYHNLISDYHSYAKFIVSFLEALNLPQVHLVGHSLGGGIAITLATLIPDRVKSLVLLDSTGIPSVSIPEIVPRRAIEMTAQISIPKLKLQFFDIPKVFTHNLLFNTGNIIYALLISLYQDSTHLLPSIKAPCLILWSEKDLTTPLATAREMANHIPNATLTIVKEGYHEWMLWHPEKLASIALDFIKQVELG
ncbi:alpha/beta hydrolase [Chroococcidiopsis sp. FACHB-1243]|uniref:alpha/beta fold hydrolase n=1 Tax=Chroococcidiopsis sp. [FACHB-1243] TaxID=2692781 RepID=UPI00177C74F5|nr:alpha/beta hydrolase [Chroococcidiopsis sp. [FACHB-1243]]MBD2304581.1 alpha/beta hydrolase [Chroococcidiopsis sp. [FACHB-1243]]